MSKRLAGKAEEEVKEDDGGQEEAATPLACDPSLSEVQATSIPSSKLYTACTYHLLLIHIRITQQFTHHAKVPLSALQIFLLFCNVALRNTITHKHAHTWTHTYSLSGMTK